jgi:hypothetical protein
MVASLDFEGPMFHGMNPEEARRMFEETSGRVQSSLRKRALSEGISLWVTAVIGAFILLGSFFMIMVVFEPWLGLWAVLPSIAYIIGFFAMVSESPKKSFT